MFRTAAAVSVALLLAGGGLRASSDPAASATTPIPVLHIVLFGQPRFVVSDAILGAIRRVAKPKCESLLTYFNDQGGRPLAVNLASSGRTAGEFLAQLRFAEGAGMRQCENERVVAATKPGSHVVFICSQRFEREYRPDILGGEMIIVHELLHSLGLGENPPTSLEITAAVTARCGD